jgi:hypothetical protein
VALTSFLAVGGSNVVVGQMPVGQMSVGQTSLANTSLGETCRSTEGRDKIGANELKIFGKDRRMTREEKAKLRAFYPTF